MAEQLRVDDLRRLVRADVLDRASHRVAGGAVGYSCLWGSSCSLPLPSVSSPGGDGWWRAVFWPAALVVAFVVVFNLRQVQVLEKTECPYGG
jgi:hypothetical protein